MKNKELYESIERLVNRTDNQFKNKQSQALEYCKKQIKKKRLTPKNPRFRIDELLENFSSIKTYVNVKDLIECVNEAFKIHEQENEKKHPLETHVNRNIIEDEEDIDMKVLEKAYRVLRRGYQREFTKEN